jgi:ABC-type sugar transport system ATPase subunit
MQMGVDMKPKFLRFPGGNYLEGDQIADRFDWKKTIGPLSDRPGLIVMISSDMEETLNMSDRVAVMHEGAITGVLARGECTEERIMTLAVG